MTLISEQIFKPYSACYSSPRFDAHVAACMKETVKSGSASGEHDAVSPAGRLSPRAKPGRRSVSRKRTAPPDRTDADEAGDSRRKRLVRLIDQDCPLHESGTGHGKPFRRSKRVAKLVKAVKAMTDGKQPDVQAPYGLPDLQAGKHRSGWPHSGSVPLGVEAFRMAVARELTLIRHKKENIP